MYKPILANADDYLGNEDDEKDGAVGVYEALVLMPGTAAPEQSDGADDSS